MKTLNRLSDTLPKNQNGSTGLPLCSEVVLFMKEIPLTQGKVAIIDDKNYEKVNQFKWHAIKQGASNRWYAIRSIRVDGVRTKQPLQVFIMGKNGNKIVDHWDHNGLNCQEDNLRFCTQKENSRNRSKRKNRTSEYKGVTYYIENNIYRCSIWVNNSSKHLGYYKTGIGAANAYNRAALKYFGEFACLNDVGIDKIIEKRLQSKMYKKPKNMKISEIIIEHRTRAGISQSELANLLGVELRSVRKWETGKCEPIFVNYKAIISICKKITYTNNKKLSK